MTDFLKLIPIPPLVLAFLALRLLFKLFDTSTSEKPLTLLGGILIFSSWIVQQTYYDYLRDRTAGLELAEN